MFLQSQNNRLPQHSPVICAEQIRSRIRDGAIQRAQHGSRNVAIHWLGQQERDNGISQEQAEHDAEIVAATVGLGRREAINAVRSAYRRPAREPWGSGRVDRPRPAVPRNTTARFRSEEFKRLLAAASDAAQVERITRARGLELIRALDFDHPDWAIIDAHCLDDQHADRLVKVATWLERAPEAEVSEYRREVSR